MILIYALIWWLSGFDSFVWWFSSQHDLDNTSAFFGVLAGTIGPFAFVAGWLVHGSGRDIVWVKRRKS